MLINNCSRYNLADCAVQAEPANGPCPVSVAVEHRMEVLINERPAMRVICTPEHLDELVVGRLLTEGLIRQPDDVQGLYICDSGLRAKVLLREGAEAALTEARGGPDIATCCTDNRTLLTGRQDLPPAAPAAWDAGWLISIAARMKQEEPLYAATHAVHGCYLARQDEVLCCREDLGRHNAMDKVIGWACIRGVDLRECLLFTTGRLPSDMVSKAIRSGVPLLASKTYPTDLGIRLAAEAGLTLVTVRSGGGLLVWNDGTP